MKPIADAIEAIFKPNCTLFHFAGSYRRQCADCGDLEVVCQIDHRKLNALGMAVLNAGIGVKMGRFRNDSRYIKLMHPSGLQIDVFIPQKHDYYRQLAIRTGNANFAHTQLAKSWRKLGWVGTADGLRLEKECILKGDNKWICTNIAPVIPRSWESEEDFFEWLELDWKYPEERNL